MSDVDGSAGGTGAATTGTTRIWASPFVTVDDEVAQRTTGLRFPALPHTTALAHMSKGTASHGTTCRAKPPDGERNA